MNIILPGEAEPTIDLAVKDALFNVVRTDEASPSLQRRKLARMLVEKYRRLASSNLYFFCKYVLNMRDMETTPHWELCQFLQRYGHNSDCLILLPRGTFKSSIISVGYTLWRFTKDRDLRVLLTSAELSNAKNFLSLVRQHIESNNDFQMLFGKWHENKGDTWHQTALSFAGRKSFRAEESVTAASSSTSKVSQHYDWAVIDDLVNEKTITSREMIDGQDQYLQELLPILDPIKGDTSKRGPRLVVGTRWHFDDNYGRIIAREQKYRSENRGKIGFRMLIRKAIEPDGTEYFPARFSRAALLDLKEKAGMSNYTFSCQYLNDPLPEEDAVFRITDIGFFNEEEVVMDGKITPLPKMLNFFITIDPSLGQDPDSDYTATITVGCDSAWNMYVVEVNREHINPDQILERMFQQYLKYKPYRMGVETVAFQKSLLFGFNKLCRERGVYFKVDELKTDNRISKEMRIRGFQPFVQGRKLYLKVKPKTKLTLPAQSLYYQLEDNQGALLDEMLRFPLAATKDCVDALAYMPQLVFPTGSVPAPPPDPKSFGSFLKRLGRFSAPQGGFGYK